MFRIVIGLQCFLPPYPHTLALYQVSVRQTRYLPLTSFRFHLAMDTLVSLAIRFPLSGLVGDLHPLDNAHAEHTITPEVLFYRTSGRDYMLLGVLLDSNITKYRDYWM